LFETFGTPDILVNNAGYLAQPEILRTADIRDWWKSFEVNVLGTATVIKAFLRAKTPEKEAVIITLNTLAAHMFRVPTLSSYAASKAAELRMIEMFQAEQPEVRFISVHPGAVATDMGAKSGVTGIPITDAELASNFILWATSPEADFLKGRFSWVNW